ncbi:hypothetical protein ACA910_022121 [Epithemia clementina (nom. ined.)]
MTNPTSVRQRAKQQSEQNEISISATTTSPPNSPSVVRDGKSKLHLWQASSPRNTQNSLVMIRRKRRKKYSPSYIVFIGVPGIAVVVTIVSSLFLLFVLGSMVSMPSFLSFGSFLDALTDGEGNVGRRISSTSMVGKEQLNAQTVNNSNLPVTTTLATEQHPVQQQYLLSSSSSDTNDIIYSTIPAEGISTTLQQQEENDNSYNFQTQSLSAPVCQPLPDIQSISYTLVTQLSESRLWMMEHICQKWKQPISIAIFDNDIAGASDGKHGQSHEEQHAKHKFYRQQLDTMGCDQSKLAMVVVQLANSKNYTAQSKTTSAVNEYPVNLLRNRALAQVQTTHVVYIDIDFWPSSDLYDVLNQPNIRQHLQLSSNDHDSDKTALVIPAFQVPRQCREYYDCREANIKKGMPKNRKELIRKLNKRQASRFDPANVGGHGSTRYRRWMNQNASQLLEISCFQSNRYEPYLVVRYCRDMPPFQEAFSGYGKNKLTWIMHLRRLGWRFWQIGGAFLVHYPHLDSPTRQLWNGGKNGRRLRRPENDDNPNIDFQAFVRGQNDLKYLEFKKWLFHNVADQSIVTRCPAEEVRSFSDVKHEDESEDEDDNNDDDDPSKLWVPRRVIRLYKEEFKKYKLEGQDEKTTILME